MNRSETVTAVPRVVRRVDNVVLVALVAACLTVIVTNHLFIHAENIKTLNHHVVFFVFFLVPDLVGGISAGVLLGRLIKRFLRRRAAAAEA